jgi:uncharacterized membrane protein
MTDNVAGALCYLLGIITGVLFLVLSPYNQNKNVRFHAFQSIFLNAGVIVLSIALTILSIVIGIIPVVGAIIAMVLYFGFMIGIVVVWLMMMFRTYKGEKVVLPVIGPLAEKQA